MTTLERKEQVLARLQKTDNESLIEGVYRLLELDTEYDEIYKLSETQKKVLAKSDKQIDEGKYITDEELNNKIDKWLSE